MGELTAKCRDVQVDWLKIWNLYSAEEVKWFKKNYPSNTVGEKDDSKIHYKQAMETAKEVNKKELLCLTLFTIDDECVKWPYIRLNKWAGRIRAAMGHLRSAQGFEVAACNVAPR